VVVLRRLIGVALAAQRARRTVPLQVKDLGFVRTRRPYMTGQDFKAFLTNEATENLWVDFLAGLLAKA
jgi:hypothetical protein